MRRKRGEKNISETREDNAMVKERVKLTRREETRKKAEQK